MFFSALLVPGIALGSLLPSAVPGSEIAAGPPAGRLVRRGCTANVCTYSQACVLSCSAIFCVPLFVFESLESHLADADNSELRPRRHGHSAKVPYNVETVRLLQLHATNSGFPNYHYHSNAQ